MHLPETLGPDYVTIQLQLKPHALAQDTFMHLPKTQFKLDKL